MFVNTVVSLAMYKYKRLISLSSVVLISKLNQITSLCESSIRSALRLK
jgi:hypothetical protein